MEFTLRDAKARFSQLVAAAERGEEIVVTKNGVPTVEIKRVPRKGGIDFVRLARDRARLGFTEDEPVWPSEFDDPAFSRRVLGLED